MRIGGHQLEAIGRISIDDFLDLFLGLISEPELVLGLQLRVVAKRLNDCLAHLSSLEIEF